MKTANFVSFLLLAAAVSMGVTGCKKTPKSPTPIFGHAQGAPSERNPSGIETPGPAVPQNGETRATPLPATTDASGNTPLSDRPGDLSNYDQDREIFRQDTVYFEFDKYNVKPSELNKVQSVANYLKGQPGNSVLVEGHCDERGTPGYNLALGDRRALSVRESLINFGVPSERVHTISYGEDKPADLGHNEAAYSKNRRSEFVLLKPKSGAAADARGAQ
jgi:peptidoglycan-associated lipoprotein